MFTFPPFNNRWHCVAHTKTFFPISSHTQKIQTWPKIYPKNIEIQDKKKVYSDLRPPCVTLLYNNNNNYNEKKGTLSVINCHGKQRSSCVLCILTALSIVFIDEFGNIVETRANVQ